MAETDENKKFIAPVSLWRACAVARSPDPGLPRFNALMMPMRANIVGPPDVATSHQGFHRGLPLRGLVLPALGQPTGVSNTPVFFLRDTGHLRAAGSGAYLLLLFHHWSTGSLPDDDEQLSAIARMMRGEWKKAKPIIAKFFQPGWVHGGVWWNDLAEAKESYAA